MTWQVVGFLADEQLLIIYEAEAEQWASYLHSIFAGSIPDSGICCYDIATASRQSDDFLQLAMYTCKLLILSKGMLEGLPQVCRCFLARVLRPAAHVVVLLCGVESLSPLTDLVALNADECVQISTKQDTHEYLSAVINIVRKAASGLPLAHSPSQLVQKVGRLQPAGSHTSNFAVVPSRVPCESSVEVFILLRKKVAGENKEVEFSDGKKTLRVNPVHWNDLILCLNAPDFPAGNVRVTVYSDGVPISKAQIQYYSSVEEIARLLSGVADPVGFMCQALRVSSAETLDHKLSSMLLKRMPTGGFQGLQCETTPEGERHHTDVPTLLHFAAHYGFKSVSSLLLQCPGAERALCTANRRGQTPTDIAWRHGHAELHDLLKKALEKFTSGEDDNDASVYKMMCTAGNPSATNAQHEQQGEGEGSDEEDPYAVLGVNDDCDTNLTSKNTVLLANRPPAPNPRPESTHVKEEQTPYIIQVFQKKTTQGDANSLYSLPTKQACDNKDNASSTYDTISPNLTRGLEGSVELQQKVKVGLFTSKATKIFSDYQRVDKDMDDMHQENLNPLGAGIINHRDNDDSVYDKISIVHHTPSATGNEHRRGNQATSFYSKPAKGQPVRSPLLTIKINMLDSLLHDEG
ncbi:B-cell scaffold protein with ankyrin repeats-like [Thalassophryne amazonica]|uniref:B-cell scaffold protein with ankyrin repeats-like n=1 Tax=Thalassophryne amazonica TaxID=390379 RepID=UPI0014708AB7|nr:B-cell scaffold protein with ankyrin repeats-like [Thalassophryne amazonica]